MKVPLSVIILAKNEEVRIEDCIKNVADWAEEIVVVDDESTDRTVEIASKYTDKIFKRKMELEGRQRNFGANQAKFDWVMMVDCDEFPTPALKDEIAGILKDKKDNIVAYWVPKINYLGKVNLKFGGWSNPNIKLYDRRHLRWVEAEYDVIHPGITIDPGFTGALLKNPNIHYNFSSIEDFIKKDNRNSTYEALKWHLGNKKMGLGRALWRTQDRFFRRFIGRKGYKDGFYGFMAAFISGCHEMITYAKLREIREFGMYKDRLKK